MAWYRKYRPAKVSDLALEPVRLHMEKLLQSGNYAHAYLFAGPRGVGKTSTARLLAKILNDPQNSEKILAKSGPLVEPDSENALLKKITAGQSTVMLEQDAASHRGIDDIRSLQEQVSVIPTEGLIRVVILDEVHMLTNEAFNALLKLLEEPPARVVFVLATTELHKVPDTVQSRCELLRFRQASETEIKWVLQQIAQQEGFTLEEDVAQSLVIAAAGSFRDAVKNLESVVIDNQVDSELLAQLVGSQSEARQLLAALATKNIAQVTGFFELQRQSGINFSVLEQALFRQLHDRLHRAIERNEKKSTIVHIAALLDFLVNRIGGYEPLDGLKLELACVGWCLEGADDSDDEPAKLIRDSTSKAVKKNETKVKETAPAIAQTKDIPTVSASISAPLTANFDRQELMSNWGEFLLKVRTKSAALESLLRNCEIGDISQNQLELLFGLKFHIEKIQQPKYFALLNELLQEQFQVNAEVRCALLTTSEENQPEFNQQNSTGEDQLLAAVESAVLALEN